MASYTLASLLFLAVVPGKAFAKVNCGQHEADSCAKCGFEHGHTLPDAGEVTMCNGDCIEIDGKCELAVASDVKAKITNTTPNATAAPTTTTSSWTAWDSSASSSGSSGGSLASSMSSSGSLNTGSSVSASSASSGSYASGSSGSFLQVWQWLLLVGLCLCCLAAGGGAAAMGGSKKPKKKRTVKKEEVAPVVEEAIVTAPTGPVIIEPLLPAIAGAYPVTTQYTAEIPATYAVQMPIATSTFAMAPTAVATSAYAVPSYGMLGPAQMAPTVQYAAAPAVL